MQSKQQRLDALKEKRYPFTKAGIKSTAWDDEIASLEKQIQAANKPPVKKSEGDKESK